MKRIVFMGTSSFAVPILKSISENSYEVSMVYTQPPKKSDRGQKIKKSPIQTICEELSLKVRTPNNFDNIEEEKSILKNLKPDLVLVVAYGQIIQKELLGLYSDRFINIHASLLPKWRGAAPIQRSLMEMDEETGISIMKITPKLDAGPVFCSESIRLEEDETYGSLSNKLALLGSDKLMETISAFKKGIFKKKSQDDKFATYAAKITKEDRKINWNIDALTIERKIRALNPTPGATTQFNNQIIKLYEVRIEKNITSLPPGDWLIDKKKKQIIVGTTTDSISITRIQKPGGKIMDIKEFLNGFTNKNDV